MPDSAYRVVSSEPIAPEKERQHLNFQQICDRTTKNLDSAFRVVRDFD
jgi:hypothetical protein